MGLDDKTQLVREKEMIKEGQNDLKGNIGFIAGGEPIKIPIYSKGRIVGYRYR